MGENMSSKTEVEMAKKKTKVHELRDSCNFFPNRLRCYEIDGVINIDFGFSQDGDTIKIQSGVALGRTMVETMIKQLTTLLEKK